jgi:hypothetical protein
MQPKVGDPRISEKDQKAYRSVVESLSYLTKHSRSDILRSVWELSKSMDGATPLAFKEMKQLIKFMIYSNQYGWKQAPSLLKTKKCKLEAYTDL